MQGGFGYFHSYKFWLGGQTSFTVTDKYKHKKKVDWGRPSIMCMNEDPCQDRAVDVAWLLGNCEIVNVTQVLASVRANTP
jgi:hypothetical protein